MPTPAAVEPPTPENVHLYRAAVLAWRRATIEEHSRHADVRLANQIGYARTSTLEQTAGLDAQLRDLKAAGVEKIFSEQLSSVDADRPQLQAALDFVREGDVLVITKIDRIARSVAHLCEIEAKLHAKGASLKVLTPQLDTSTPIGRLVFNMVGAIAQFEREIMLERQREGIAKAKAAGKYKGRAPTARAKAEEVVRRLRDIGGAVVEACEQASNLYAIRDPHQRADELPIELPRVRPFPRPGVSAFLRRLGLAPSLREREKPTLAFQKGAFPAAADFKTGPVFRTDF